jgi:hypothetical protein
MARIYNSVAFPYENPNLIASFDVDDGCNRVHLFHDIHQLYVRWFEIPLGMFCSYYYYYYYFIILFFYFY